MRFFKEQDNKALLITNYYNRADLLLDRDEDEKAYNLYHKSLKLADSIGERSYKLDAYNGLSQYFMKKNEIDSAHFYAKKSFVKSEEIKSMSQTSIASKLMYKINKQLNNKKEALKYLEIYENTKDSLYNKEKAKELGRLEAELEFKNLKKQYQLDRAAAEEKSRLQQETKHYQILVLIGSIITFIVILILLYILIIKNKKARRKLEEKNLQITTRNQQLKELHLQKNKLFSVISHDLRGPLDNLNQMIQLYLSGSIDKKDLQEWLPYLDESLASTRALIDNLLNWAKESLNTYNINKERLNLYENVQDKQNIYRHDIEQKQISFINKIEPNFNIYIDKNTLDLVLRNLISNAIKYSDINGEISLTSFQTNENMTRVCIEDTGIGMSPEQVELLFKQNDIASAVGTHQGNGIGLILCKSYIEENDGKIWVDYSEPDKGSKICFEVPNS